MGECCLLRLPTRPDPPRKLSAAGSALHAHSFESFSPLPCPSFFPTAVFAANWKEANVEGTDPCKWVAQLDDTQHCFEASTETDINQIKKLFWEKGDIARHPGREDIRRPSAMICSRSQCTSVPKAKRSFKISKLHLDWFHNAHCLESASTEKVLIQPHAIVHPTLT